MTVMMEIKNLTKRFGGLIAVSNINLEVNQGEFIGIIGPNGAGKTTFFNLITGYLKPEIGSIILQGEDVTRFKPHEIAQRGIGRTFQIPRPFPNLTVFENVYAACISMGKRKNARSEVMKALELVGLLQQKNRLARSLSTGELKLLEVARALSTKPKLLLLDEPLAGTGADEVKRIVSVMMELHEQGVTHLIIEHLLRQLMKLVERVVVLHYGEKIAEGTPKEISKDRKVIEAYLGDVKFA